MPYIHLLLNQEFSGDSAQVVAIARQLTQAEHNVKASEYQDNDPEIVNQLSSNLKSVPGNETHVLLLSGSHGLDMLKNQAMQSVLEKHSMVIAWGGHQDPGLTPWRIPCRL
ncbi:hypothetical protein ACFQOZ_10950 [Comamonas endophytica]|uniref:hypothetical protein n=1 Tax=Comamonas endophytica TaxID=2949090 RepID=UPI00360EFB03